MKLNASTILERNHVTVLPGNGPVLLYAHGFGCSQTMWSQVTPAFMGTHHQVLFDYVGSGRSDLSAFDPVKYSQLSGYAQDLIEVCDALNLRSVHLVAHSVSCNIGILASLARPDLFASMVLVGPSPCYLNQGSDYRGGFDVPDLEGLLDLMDQNYIGWAKYLAPVVASAGTQAVNDTTSELLYKSFCSTDPRTARVFARATFFADNRNDLVHVACPAMILQHRHDALVPLEVGEYMQQKMAGSQLQVLDVQGHCAHLSHPELVIAAIRSHIG